MSDRIRDHREPGHFWADNEIVEEYLPGIGVYGFAVYMLLCKYADAKTAECDPAIPTMAKTLDVSDNTIKKALRKLRDVGLIKIEPQYETSRNGKRVNSSNLYTLLSVEKKPRRGGSGDAPGVGQEMPQGGASDAPGVGQEMPTNKTHKNNTHRTRESETPPPAPTQPSRSHQSLPSTPTQQNGTERRASQSRPPDGVGESDSGSRHTYTKEWKELARAVAAVCGYDPDKKVRSQKIRQQMRDACEALWEMGKRADDVNEWYETYWRSEKLNRGRCETYPYPAQVADEINRARPRRTPQEHTRRNPDTGEPERWDGYRWVIYGG